jgi:hypothetical protein
MAANPRNVRLSNPLAPQRNPQDFVQSSFLALLLAAQPAPPITPYDYPNPRAPGSLNQGFSDTFKLPLTTVRGFNQLDWPNPQLPPRRSEQLGFVASGSLGLTFVAPAQPFYRTDWPNPRGMPLPAVTSFTWAKFANIGDYPVTAAVVVNPRNVRLSNPLAPPRNPQDFVSGTALTLTGFVAQAPFAQFDWPNPRAAARGQDWEDVFKLPLTTVNGFNQYDWPNPRAASRGQDWQDTFKQPLTTVRPPFTQQDWPNPRGGKSVDGFANPALTLVTAPADPRRQLDWPVPRGPKPVVFDWEDTFKAPLTTVRPPYIQTDWPVPRGAKPVVLDWEDVFKSPLTTVRPPSLQRDWPVPQGPRRSGDLGLTGSGLSLTTVVVYPVGFFNQFDWPNPRGPAPTQWRGFSDSFKLPLTTVRGFNRTDWPNPRGPVPGSFWTQPGLALQTAIVVYPAQITFDWPNPRGPIPSVSLRTWTDSFKLPLTTVKGFNQYIWPVPAGPRSNPYQVTSSSAALLLQLNPFAQRDWPVPKGFTRVQPWTDSFKLTLTTVRPPYIERKWPNPTVQLPRSISLRTWTQSPAVPPVVVVQRPFGRTDWPNPLILPRFTGGEFVFRTQFPPPVVVPPEPPIVERVVPKHSHMAIDTAMARMALSGTTSSGRVRSAKGTTSSRWRKSRGRIRSARSKTTPRDDP